MILPSLSLRYVTLFHRMKSRKKVFGVDFWVYRQLFYKSLDRIENEVNESYVIDLKNAWNVKLCCGSYSKLSRGIDLCFFFRKCNTNAQNRICEPLFVHSSVFVGHEAHFFINEYSKTRLVLTNHLILFN